MPPTVAAETFTCPLSNDTFPRIYGIDATMMPAEIVERIQQDVPDYDGGPICETCYNDYTAKTLETTFKSEMDTFSELEQNVIACLREQKTIATNIDEQFDRERSPDEVIADRVVGLVGSWRFVGMVAVLIATWIILHIALDLGTLFNLHPLVLMNIVLACWAAVQGPIILLSQNRQKARDRKRAAHDYQVNLKAEFEVRYLHAKIDLMVARQQRRLMEIQEAQMRLIEKLVERSKQA